MTRRRTCIPLWIGAAIGAACGGLAQSAEPVTPLAAENGQYGIVRVQLDPGLGQFRAEVLKLLFVHPFVRVGEPADFLVASRPDFPLDISLVDLRQPREHWTELVDNQPVVPEPRTIEIGNLRGEDIVERLARTFTAAARARAILDRSLGEMHGIEACIQPTGLASERARAAAKCVPLAGPGARNFHDLNSAAVLRVRNASDGVRHVAAVSIDGSFEVRRMEDRDAPAVRTLAPGEEAQFYPWLANGSGADDPRVVLLASRAPILLDGMVQEAPARLAAKCAEIETAAPCPASLPGVRLGQDVAARSFQMILDEEPMPAMGNGSDVPAHMALWMAQFYSIVPYTKAEIEADSKLPGERTQFLALRSPEERQHRCGATLIATNLVLTAAHCVAKGQFAGDGLRKVMDTRRIRLGTRKLGKEGHSFAIAGVAVHAGYDGVTPRNDIALLLLAPDRGTGQFRQQPILLAERPLGGGVSAHGFGWGFTGSVGPNGNMMMAVGSRVQQNPDVLQYGEMRSVSFEQCARKLPRELAPGMVCLYSKAALDGGASADGVFTCRGDSGGPLVRKVGGRDVLVGVVSWSKGCGFKDYPSVFTDAGSYAAWISAARAQLKPGMAIRVAEPARPSGDPRRP